VRTPDAMPTTLGDTLSEAFHAGCRRGGLDGAIRFQVAALGPSLAAGALGTRRQAWTA